jgi:arginyl-tRNA synthetase
MNPRQAIAQALSRHVKVDESMIEVPPDASMGDYALPVFHFAKELRKAPVQIAADLASKLKAGGLIREIKATGPYLNFFIDRAGFAKYALKAAASPNEDKVVMVEYSSPNTNKPLHLGHVRNICIGKAVSNILKERGNKVVQSCLVNDRGVHIMKSMLAYERWGLGKAPGKKSDHFVGDFYVLFSQKSKEDERLETEAQELLKRWEAGDQAVRKQWKLMNKWAEDGFNATYKQLGIKFDKYYYESDIYESGRSIVLDGLEKGIFTKKDGAVVADINGQDKVLIRADGTTIYMTQDIYLAIQKFKDFKLKQSIYVVGSEQNNHFLQLFSILKMLRFEHADDCHHLSYGMVYLPEGRMKSREGTVVDADDLVAEMVSLAKAEVARRYEKLSEKEKDKRAKIIGLGALKFYMLRNDAARDMTYDPNESISFEGETGPYIQYAYARIASILRKAGKNVSKVEYSSYGVDEMPLLKLVAGYEDAVSQARLHLKPHIICRYLLDLSQAFNEYYHKVPVLGADPKLRDARLSLISRVKDCLKDGLALLDINVLERM